MSRRNPDRHAPLEIDEYLEAQGLEVRPTLEPLRVLVRAVAPDCTERVSYGIPIFRLRKDFVAISAARSHCSLHTISRAVPVAMKAELEAANISTSGTTIRIKPGSDLPAALIRKQKIAKLRVAEFSVD